MSSSKKKTAKPKQSLSDKPSYDWTVSSCFYKYLNQERTTQDVTRTVSFYRGLQIRFEPYVLCNGMQSKLVNLNGTVPVPYKVMTNGRSLQLLNLEGVIPVPVNGTTYNIPVSIWLMDTYPNHAPVCFVKPTADMQIKVSMFVDHNGKIYLPYLHDWTPTQSDLLGLIQVMICTFGEQPPVYARPKADDHHSAQPSPYPTQPYMPMPGVSGGGGGNPSYPPYPMSQGYPVPYPPPVYPPTAGMYPPAYSSQPQPTPPSSVGGTNTINEEHIRASLLSAVEEKLRRRLDEQFAQARAELDILQQTGTELHQGKVKLEKIIERLDTDKSELDRNVMVLREKEAELDAALARLDAEADGGGQIDVDEAVTTTTPLYKQILNAFAEEAATEDAIYYMGEALRRGVIDLDVFLKQVRSLSRKQFTLRALMHKCRLKAGLAG